MEDVKLQWFRENKTDRIAVGVTKTKLPPGFTLTDYETTYEQEKYPLSNYCTKLRSDLLKVVVWDWPLNIYTYNGFQKVFSKDIQNPKFPSKSVGICKFLYLKNGELVLNFNTVNTFEIHYFIINNLR